ncbi:hypothetical protein NW752_000040 [Fusarium irregulare]|uniref:Secreted protein n=1 Tax=Fusarium irregulare TaxID=2494466 RepID=A0A9W8Q0N7_9HYPO|nr:hypothetical protein NW766_001801 [Fusarium irregulare]KAJ4027795.1 hypothetical protein NW752_000040 [Fusarium irregulare]
MKSSLFALAVAAITPLFAAADSLYKGNEAVCGSLGVMNVAPSDIPVGVKASEVRLCADHPNGGHDRQLDPKKGASLAPFENKKPVQHSPKSLFERTCELTAPYGCSDRFCWKGPGGDVTVGTTAGWTMSTTAAETIAGHVPKIAAVPARGTTRYARYSMR